MPCLFGREVRVHDGRSVVAARPGLRARAPRGMLGAVAFAVAVVLAGLAIAHRHGSRSVLAARLGRRARAPAGFLGAVAVTVAVVLLRLALAHHAARGDERP